MIKFNQFLNILIALHPISSSINSDDDLNKKAQATKEKSWKNNTSFMNALPYIQVLFF